MAQNENQFDSERAAEAGRLSGIARQRKATKTSQERALESIAGKLGALTSELLDAALGKGDFAELDPKTRFSAITRALEYGLGKPTVDSKASQKDDEPSPGPTPEELFG